MSELKTKLSEISFHDDSILGNLIRLRISMSVYHQGKEVSKLYYRHNISALDSKQEELNIIDSILLSKGFPKLSNSDKSTILSLN